MCNLNGFPSLCSPALVTPPGVVLRVCASQVLCLIRRQKKASEGVLWLDWCPNLWIWPDINIEQRTDRICFCDEYSSPQIMFPSPLQNYIPFPKNVPPSRFRHKSRHQIIPLFFATEQHGQEKRARKLPILFMTGRMTWHDMTSPQASTTQNDKRRYWDIQERGIGK